jgi:hypothetical protein
MPAIECQNCQTLIEYWPRRGSFQVSCVRCKRLTTVSGGATVPERTARASKPYRPPIKAPPKWANARRSNSHSFQLKLFAAKVGNLVRTVVAYTVAVGLLTGFVLAYWSFTHPKELEESTGIQVESARKRILNSASALASDLAAANAPVYSSQNHGSALNKALAIPENAALRNWLMQDHNLQTPAPDMRSVTFNAWVDKSNQVLQWDGDVQTVDESIAPSRYMIRVSVDHAFAWELERHFGYPDRLGTSWAYQSDGSREALDITRHSAYHQHGIQLPLNRESNFIGPDYSWIADHSAPQLRAVATAVVGAVTRQPSTDARTTISALTSYIQYAIPYTKNVSGEQQERFNDQKYRCGLRTPMATLLVGGDCDSKSLLLLTMIRALNPNVPLALIDVNESNFPPDPSSQNNHTIAGVAIAPKPGERTLRQGDLTYVLIESTCDWGIGRLSAATKLDNADVKPIP